MNKVTRFGFGLVLSLLASFVLADSPHCQNCSDSVGDTGQLIVAYDVAGLGGETTAGWTLTATLEGHARCKNGGDNCPSAANKFGPVGQGAQGTFSVHNGRARGTISLPAGITLGCPGGQTPTLLDVEWSNIVLTVDGVQVFTDDSISRIFAACN